VAGGERVAIGIRVKSGVGIGVVAAAPIASPRVLDRVEIELADRDKPELRQPYHHGMGRLEEDTRLIATRTCAIDRTTAHNVREWLRRLDREGYAVHRVGLVVGSVIDPATVGSPHIRAHAFEGRLFRRVLECAFEEHSLPPAVFVERRAFADAVATLRHPESAIRERLATMGKEAARKWPWRVDEKLAALAAWLVLA
jgi:hypothetical protein